MKKLSILLVALMLTACGSSSHDDGFPPNPTPPPPVVVAPPAPPPTPAPPPPAPVADSFFTQLMAFITGQSETAEPVDIAAMVGTAPENTEPTPL